MTELWLVWAACLAVRVTRRRSPGLERCRARSVAAMTAPAHAALAPHEERFVAGFRGLAEQVRDEDPRHRRGVDAPVAVALERALARSAAVDAFRADPLSAPFVVPPELTGFYTEITQEIRPRGGAR